MNLRSARLLAASIAFAALPVFAQNLATVNGKPIPNSRADAIVKQLVAQGQKDSPQLREMIKNDLIGREILLQEAGRKGLTNSAEVRDQIEAARQMIIIGALRADFIKSHPSSDTETKAEYDRLKQLAGDTDYHLRHILVATEAEAKDVLAKIKGGANFEDLAKQEAQKAGSNSGGDLGWMNPTNFVKPFHEAVLKLSKGQITEAPVRTEFGFHVIKLEETRSHKFPAFDEIKPQVEKSVMDKKLREYHESLIKKAKVGK
jgi:peptidyl-prolyl cis-trans isomerase C